MTYAKKTLQITRWSAAILFVGMLTGAMAVILPPLASIGFVALLAVILLWALPELQFVPEKQLRITFLAMIFVLLCVPAYFAIDTGVLPWISIRRISSIIVILLFSLTIAGSKSARDKLASTARFSRPLMISAVGFLFMMFISIFSSANWPYSTSQFFDALLNWYVPLFVCILIVRNEEDIILLMKIVAIAMIVDCCAGVIEFALERRYYFDIFPKSLLDAMFSANPALEAMYYANNFRNGLYRASSIYTVPLSFGELAAIAAPIGSYFIFHGHKWSEFALGFLTVAACIIALFCSGARGGFIAFLTAMPIMLAVWTIRYSKQNPSSLVGAIFSTAFFFGFAALVGLIFAWQRLYNIVLGGGDTAASTEARLIQWNLAKPHILSNPVTGHGIGMAAELVGFYNPGSRIPTLDSYLISLLVDVGVPGLLFFFSMISLGIWICLRQYLTNGKECAAIAGPIACSLIAFTVYRMALSQRENHTLFFLLVGLVFAIGRLTHERFTRQSGASIGKIDLKHSPSGRL